MPTADELLSRQTAADLAACLRRATGGAPLPHVAPLARTLDGTFSERILALRDAVLADLPHDYPSFAVVLRTALEDPSFDGWMIWPVGEAVAVRALADGRRRAFDDGLALLARLTPRLTAEAALRPFLAADLDRALTTVMRWTRSPDEHVRRLASEGTRPRLPWARRVRAILDRPEATVPILDALHRDPSEYVRRSVANHLNDLSRAHPALAVEVAARWAADEDPTTARVVRHALRTLVKQGDPAALALLGFPPPSDLVVTGPVLDAAHVPAGGDLRFTATLENRADEPARLAIDYVVHYVKANGRTAPKVFKLGVRTLAPGERVTVSRTQSFRPISTRRHYPGEHALELQVNGAPFGRTAFALGG
jgi:3-methyladenine DNA glycosylase AlkC